MAEAPHVTIVGPDGKPARAPADARCPRCGAGADQRISPAFGKTIEYCKSCGYEFPQQ